MLSPFIFPVTKETFNFVSSHSTPFWPAPHEILGLCYIRKRHLVWGLKLVLHPRTQVVAERVYQQGTSCLGGRRIGIAACLRMNEGCLDIRHSMNMLIKIFFYQTHSLLPP